jgi:hypothetical protein
MSVRETSPTVDSKRKVARAAAEMANRYDDIITLGSVSNHLSRTEQEEAALSSLAYALGRAVVACGRTDEEAVHYLRLALAKNRSTR